MNRLFAAWHERPNAGAHRKGLRRHGRNRELRWKAAPSGLPSVLSRSFIRPGEVTGTAVVVVACAPRSTTRQDNSRWYRIKAVCQNRNKARAIVCITRENASALTHRSLQP